VPIDKAALEETLARLRANLMAWRRPDGHWEGELSSSALATATATTALTLVDQHVHQTLIRRGLDWLAAHQNADGGWGDSVLSKSNISTTALGWAAFGAQTEPKNTRDEHPPRITRKTRIRELLGLKPSNPILSDPCAPCDPWSSAPSGLFSDAHRAAVARAEAWLAREAGDLAPDAIASAVIRRYGKDRTFSVPILTMCALAGRLGSGRDAWRRVFPLPFELAACPHRWFKWLRLHVVSYALPALIAIGQAHYHHRPPRNPLIRLLRHATRRRTLRILEGIQPESGGFLEAVPLTSFVTMSLASIGQSRHPVTAKGVEFLLRTAREDASWPIDVNLSIWVTTLAVNALAAGGRENFAEHLPEADRARVLEWLLAQQYTQEHPYTHAAPGAWAWTNLTGGVPDGDDTPGALLAIRNLTKLEKGVPRSNLFERAGHGQPQSGTLKQGLSVAPERVLQAVEAGIAWLLDLQNRDGGIPTFCQGWGALPLDRSGADLTAHALRAWTAWLGDLGEPLRRRTEAAIRKALAYLARTQHPDGSWVPLWFGCQFLPTEENPTYGTARVIQGLLAAWPSAGPAMAEVLGRGIQWLLGNQSDDGGWGGARPAPSTIEETAIAVEALAGLLTGRPDAGAARADFPAGPRIPRESVEGALERGVAWLIERTDRGRSLLPAPLGFYFAKLWYFDRLYPIIFALAALGHTARLKS